MSEQSVLSRYEIVENEGDEYLACLQIGPLCASVQRTKDGYVPSFADNEWGDPIGNGEPSKDPETAARDAIALAQGYLRAMSMAFAGFAETEHTVTL